MNFILTSVPHSGTRFFKALLRPNELVHFTSGAWEKFMREADLVAVAIRHPRDVWGSWWRRGKVNGTKVEPDKKFWQCWERFRTFRHRQCYYLPIDHEERDERLGYLLSYLNAPIIPNWDHVITDDSQQYPDRGPAPEIDLSPAFEVPIIKELYNGR